MRNFKPDGSSHGIRIADDVPLCLEMYTERVKTVQYFSHLPSLSETSTPILRGPTESLEGFGG